MTKIAVLQMTSGIDPDANCGAIIDAIAEARAAGAALLFTPEMSLLLDSDRGRAAQHIDTQKTSRHAPLLGQAAQEQGLYLSVGAPVRLESGRLANRTWFFTPQGQLHIYDKMHMFDVELADGEAWRESAAYDAGDAAVTIADTPVGTLGLTTCYDVRFPALFDVLGRAPCDVISVPAAFTRPTGSAHWHVLLRARAIEASAYVVAAAQVGEHADGRATFGHSLVIDPWGEVVLDMGGERPGLGYALIDPARIASVRAQVPSLANRRSIPA